MTDSGPDRIYLSPPHLSGHEARFIHEALDSNWIAPLGPQVDAFEREFSAMHEGTPALALSTGTAALHLALLCLGVRAGDDVLVSTLTFAGSVFPICYLGANPVFIDSETESWNMDPALLERAIVDRTARGQPPKAVVVVHLYGQSANMRAVSEICGRHGIALIEDAAEALGGSHDGKPVGTVGDASIFSFNGNKIVTTSGGGMLLARDAALIAHARKLATQARDPFVHYEHSEIGFNYRMSNILAAVGRGQLMMLPERVAARRAVFARYQQNLADIPGCAVMPEAPWGTHTRWLTCLTLDSRIFGTTPEAVRMHLEAANIEARPLWKPMHLQPVFAGRDRVGGEVAEELFRTGLCLPSGSSLTIDQVDRVSALVREAATAGLSN